MAHPTEARWEIVTPATFGRERAFMASAFDAEERRLWVHGGILDNDAFHVDLSVLDLSVDPPAWTTTEALERGPGGRFAHTAAWDSTRRRMVVHGGAFEADETWNDTYTTSRAPELDHQIRLPLISRSDSR